MVKKFVGANADLQPTKNAVPHFFSPLSCVAAANPSDRAAPERARPRRRAHRWVNAPPSSGLSGASSRPLAPMRRRAALRPDLVVDADPEEVRRRDLRPDHTPTSGGRVLPAHPADPRPVYLRPTVAARRSG
jgi:hypothetical protein